MTLAIFDLDNTLLAGDSDHAWGLYLVQKGLVDAKLFAAGVEKFYQDYVAGTLDIYAYQRFVTQPLQQLSVQQIQELQHDFMSSCIEPIILPQAETLLAHHKKQGHYLLIITATNRMIAEPIAKRLGVDDLLATDIEFTNDRYTGEIQGVPCFQEGKVLRLREWLGTHDFDLQQSYFYSDSRNDLPLLRQVGFPHAVDADSYLTQVALDAGWPQISLRKTK